MLIMAEYAEIIKMKLHDPSYRILWIEDLKRVGFKVTKVTV